MVNVYVPTGVFEEAVTFSVDDPEPLLIEVGVKLAVVLLGSPARLSATALANPPSGVTETV